MLRRVLATVWPLVLVLSLTGTAGDQQVPPRVLISVLVMNKAGILPHFLDRLGRLSYPKDRITLWMHCDEVQGDSSCDILHWWATSSEVSSYSDSQLRIEVSHPLHSVDDQSLLMTWGVKRMERIIALRQRMLEKARKFQFPWVFYLDADVLLTDVDVIQKLQNASSGVEELGILAPYIEGGSRDSNFIIVPENGDLSKQDSAKYFEIVNHTNETKLMNVDFVHSAFMLRLSHPESWLLTFNPLSLLDQGDQLWQSNAPFSEVVTLGSSAREGGIKAALLREKHPHGFMSARQLYYASFRDEEESQMFAKLSAVRRGPLFNFSLYDGSGLTFDRLPEISPLPSIQQVYVINLKRRPEKRARMEFVLKHLGINHTIVNAIDGEALDEGQIQSLNIGLPPKGYVNIYSKDRSRHLGITAGSAALTLTSLFIWDQIVSSELDSVLILEDDAHFVEKFREKLASVMEELEAIDPNWDLLYLGRKRLTGYRDTLVPSPWNEGETSQLLCRPGYSHWTIAMVVRRQGAQKLLQGEPLKHIVPLDEYIPVLSGAHFDTDLIALYPSAGKLNTYALYTDLIEPMRYSSEQGHISDTEDYVDTLPYNWFANSDQFLPDGSAPKDVEEGGSLFTPPFKNPPSPPPLSPVQAEQWEEDEPDSPYLRPSWDAVFQTSYSPHSPRIRSPLDPRVLSSFNYPLPYEQLSFSMEESESVPEFMALKFCRDSVSGGDSSSGECDAVPAHPVSAAVSDVTARPVRTVLWAQKDPEALNDILEEALDEGLERMAVANRGSAVVCRLFVQGISFVLWVVGSCRVLEMFSCFT